MDRSTTTAVLTELAKAQSAPVHLVEAYFDSATVYVTDAHRNISWNGNSYLANGQFLSISPIAETAELNVHQVTARYTGVDQTWISLFLNEEYIDRRLVVRKAFLEATDTVIVDTIPIFDGRMDAPILEEDPDPDRGTADVSLTASSAFADFERRSVRRTNHEDQQIHFSGDDFFEFVSELVRDVLWGVPNPSAAGAGTSGGAGGNDDNPPD